MIQDVDESLRALVRREALNGADVEIAFEAPTKEWSARRNAPTLDLYLYDIREDLQRRIVEWEDERDTGGIVTERRPPARHYKLSYLVTAWTQRPEDEHRLLSAVLSCFVRNERLPPDLLTGALVGTRFPVLATIALPPPSDRSLSDVWSALGGELKPSLDLVVIAPLEDRRQEIPGPPVVEEPRIRIRARESARDEAAAEEGAPGGPRRGEDGGAPGRAGRRRPGAAPAASVAPVEETVQSGTESRPGRVIRLRTTR